MTPRLIGRLEIRYENGGTDVIVTDRSWRTALGPLVTDAWYSGSDCDARRKQPGWDRPRSDLSATAKRRDGSVMGWTDAGFASTVRSSTSRWGATPPPGTLARRGATQAAQALALDAGLVPADRREQVPSGRFRFVAVGSAT